MAEENRTEIRTPEQVLEVLQGTPFEFLVNALRYGIGEFDSELEDVADDETVIGEATEIELIFRAAGINAAQAAMRIREENNEKVCSTPPRDQESPDFCQFVRKNKANHELLSQLAETMALLLWFSVEGRMNLYDRPMSIGVRKGGCSGFPGDS